MGEKLESYQKAKPGLHVPAQQKIAEKKSSMPLHVRRRHQLLRRIEDQSIINKKLYSRLQKRWEERERDGAWRELLLFNIFFSNLKIYSSLTKTTAHPIGEGFAHVTNCYD